MSAPRPVHEGSTWMAGAVLPSAPPERDKLLATMLLGWRRCRGFSQRELAAAIGCHPTYVSHIENGRRSMSLDTLSAACAMLGLVVEVRLPLLTEQPPPSPESARSSTPKERT